MTKIKNFRLSLRPREVARLLKAQQGVQITPELEASIEHAVNDVKRLLQPAAIYTTLTKAAAGKTTSLALTDAAVAVSVIAVTVGPKLREGAAAAAGNDAMQTALLGAVEQEAVQQATQFALKLIQDQAKEEECEMSAPVPAESAMLPSLGTLLGVQRIGLEINPESPALPAHARITWTLWTPLRKSGSKKSDSSARAEKTAA